MALAASSKSICYVCIRRENVQVMVFPQFPGDVTPINHKVPFEGYHFTASFAVFYQLSNLEFVLHIFIFLPLV